MGMSKICPLCETPIEEADARMVDGRLICVYCILKIVEWVNRQAEKLIGQVIREGDPS